MNVKDDHYTYRITWSSGDSEYLGLCAEFPSLSWLAKTPESALRGIHKLVCDCLEDIKNNHEPIPEPIATKQYSGRFVVRVLPEVHRDLVLQAAESHVSLNRLVSTRLQSRNA